MKRRGFREGFGRLLALTAVTLLAVRVPWAQPEPGSPAADSELPVQETPPLALVTIADREPYNRWKVHTGPAQDAVVHVRVTLKDTATGETQVREGSGFVVRCDGFVMGSWFS